jgi:hypothetical protein
MSRLSVLGEAIQFYLSKIQLNIIHPPLGLPSRLFPSGLPTNNLYAFLFSPIRATCPVLAKSTNHEAPHHAVFSTSTQGPFGFFNLNLILPRISSESSY